MSLDRTQLDAMVGIIDGAERQAREIPKLTDRFPDLDIDGAYEVQDAVRDLKQRRGRRVVGYKAGLTSRAKMIQMGVQLPVFGYLMGDTEVASGDEIAISGLIHPKVEAEIAFVLARPLKGPGCHAGVVLAATDYVVGALEVIDSRYENFRFDVPSVIADNTSAARFVIGDTVRRVDQVDVRTIGIVMEKNGSVAAMAAGAAVLGHPAAAVAMLANQMAARGQELPAGAVILSGGATEAIPVAAGDAIRVRLQGLGNVRVRFI